MKEKISKCPNCEKDVVSYTGRRPKKYCDEKCRMEHWNKTHPKKSVPKTLENKIEKLLNNDGYNLTKKDVMQEILDTGIIITHQTENGTRVLRAGTEEWFNALDKVRGDGYEKKPDMERKSPENYTNGQDYTYTINSEEIKKQIAAIRAEKIPKDRDTINGRKVWDLEQKNKITELQKQLNPPI